MNAARRGALGLAVRTLAWLPLCLAAWYFAAAAVGWLPAKLAVPIIASAAGEVTEARRVQRSVAYSLSIEGPYRRGGSQRAEARVDVHVATYTFGIAVFAALALAARAWRTPARMAVGLLLLLPLPALGISFDALRQLGTTAEIAGLLGWKPATREAIALGYQVGSLLLPTLAPIIAWLALFPDAWRLRPPAG
jgi:hypothetical protein